MIPELPTIPFTQPEQRPNGWHGTRPFSEDQWFSVPHRTTAPVEPLVCRRPLRVGGGALNRDFGQTASSVSTKSTSSEPLKKDTESSYFPVLTGRFHRNNSTFSQAERWTRTVCVGLRPHAMRWESRHAGESLGAPPGASAFRAADALRRLGISEANDGLDRFGLDI